jgi:hypothetical protein
LDTAIKVLEERRAYICRLTPDRALGSIEDALAFLRDRGLLTRTPDSALPSFFGACHEEPYAPASGGFGSWPATKWPWYFELAQRPDVHELKVHNGKSILFTDETLPLVDPICRSELERMEAHDEWRPLLRHLADAGPSLLEDLQLELALKPKELKLLRAPLERCGAIVARRGDDVQTTELWRYDQAHPQPLGSGGLEELVVAAVDAAIVAPERELVRKWFSWRWLFPDDLVDQLVAAGRLNRPEPGWVAAPASASRGTG